MASVLDRAADKQRKALLSLYEKNKQKVYAVALYLLGDAEKATAATVWVFSTVWKAMDSRSLTTEQEFTALALEITADYCKQQFTRQNPKALRLPQDRRFLISADVSLDGAVDAAEAVLAALPELQRLILVLHTAAGFDDAKTAAISKLDTRTLHVALADEKQTVTQLLQAAGKSDSYDDVVQVLTASKVAVPASADDRAVATIHKVSASTEKKRKQRSLIALAVTLGICVLLAAFSCLLIWDMTRTDTTSGDSSSETSDTTADDTANDSAAGTVTSVEATHYADITIQDHGTITVALDANTAPATVENFVTLAQSGFYNGLTFHRIMDGFMMQGGDPLGNGTGGSDTDIFGEFSVNGFDNPLSHVRGAISMARSSDYNSASSQFFIVHEDSTFLDGQYAAFGYVTEGMDIVDTICTAAEPTDDNGTIPAADQPIIESVTITEA